MAHWIKLIYERETYIIDLHSIGAFCFGLNNRLTFWLKDGNYPIVIHPKTHPETYQIILDYIKKQTAESPATGFWIKFNYDRNEYIIDLSRIQVFSCDGTQRIVFWLANTHEQVVINRHSNPGTYQRIQDYIYKTTGYSVP
ncbi:MULTISPECIES: hypothetical protein [Arthrospira]|uniref:Uncharacterized protein n=1 Tax=Limnospira platensis NIES-46 TaxID=1236695 RepID=A0A5M3T397_LIMPL|nr:hypothetical protein [Arthrospira platensis]AMW30240.1 hypothetical protein AP285_22210 [Arthrospira platensis YZ]KDR56446.1 hypothetical protein APPUASWS_016525 [Arthrospira platensis str. Paraca]MBD2574030.1 hypothetical protein [Arthrospira platensis FACHB-971]MBD2670351.1 hypothetical protein [Arthrospira platensis FACHB-439]MBD2710960.1 hypothetical protein [Arthrospira platensis FACHB-835]MDF2207854.1 hypothetical protein [Arthrospira platensis NCB002]MDT9184149.1 hypothetical prote